MHQPSNVVRSCTLVITFTIASPNQGIQVLPVNPHSSNFGMMAPCCLPVALHLIMQERSFGHRNPARSREGNMRQLITMMDLLSWDWMVKKCGSKASFGNLVLCVLGLYQPKESKGTAETQEREGENEYEWTNLLHVHEIHWASPFICDWLSTHNCIFLFLCCLGSAPKRRSYERHGREWPSLLICFWFIDDGDRRAGEWEEKGRR